MSLSPSSSFLGLFQDFCHWGHVEQSRQTHLGWWHGLHLPQGTEIAILSCHFVHHNITLLHGMVFTFLKVATYRLVFVSLICILISSQTLSAVTHSCMYESCRSPIPITMISCPLLSTTPDPITILSMTMTLTLATGPWCECRWFLGWRRPIGPCP